MAPCVSRTPVRSSRMRGCLPYRDSVHVMQDMRQCLNPRAYPMRGGSVLPGRDIGMLPAHSFAALPAISNLHRITPHFGQRLGRNVCGRYDFPLRLPPSSAAIRAALQRDRHIDSCHRRGLRRAAKPEKALTGLAPRGPGVGFARTFGKRCGTASAFQLLDFRAQLLDHAVLVENDLNQLIPAERVQVVQDPGCTI